MNHLIKAQQDLSNVHVYQADTDGREAAAAEGHK
jgi:hypothetical protein